MRRNGGEDDGHVIADMSGIERPSLFGAGSSLFKPKDAGKKREAREPFPVENDLSVWQMTWLALRLVLPIVFAFLGGIALFILFCQFVWFR